MDTFHGLLKPHVCTGHVQRTPDGYVEYIDVVAAAKGEHLVHRVG
jgi:hypothetical protein